MQTYIRVSKDVWVNPDKVEMVFLERLGMEGQELEKPYVVLGFAGGNGRALPPEDELSTVLRCLENRRDFDPGEPIGSNSTGVFNQTIVNEAPKQSQRRLWPWAPSQEGND